jgi:kinesin family protein 3/17
VFDVKASQQQVFQRAVMPIVDSVLDGYNGTIFCYGQTGAGKTFTMQGIPSIADGQGDLAGLIPRTSERIFSTIYARSRSQSTTTTTSTTTSTKTVVLIQVSFLEIYNETVHDLLSSYQHGLQLKETLSSGVYVKDLLLLQCRSHAQVISAL